MDLNNFVYHFLFNRPYILMMVRKQKKKKTHYNNKRQPTDKTFFFFFFFRSLFYNFIALPSMETADLSTSDTNETFLWTAECFLPASLEIKLCMILQKFIIFFLWQSDLVVKLL